MFGIRELENCRIRIFQVVRHVQRKAKQVPDCKEEAKKRGPSKTVRGRERDRWKIMAAPGYSTKEGRSTRLTAAMMIVFVRSSLLMV